MAGLRGRADVMWSLRCLLLPAAQVMGDILMGKRCDLKTDHGAFWRRFSGEQSPEDLETAMQLVYKLFTTTLEPIPAELDTYMQ